MKFKSKFLCLLLVFVMLLSVSAVAADGNETQTIEESTDQVSVNSVIENDEILGVSNDDELLGTPDNGTFTALQNRINSASPGDTIVLENDYANTDGFKMDGIIISNPLTIDGNGYTIDALNISRIFDISSSNVIIKNIDFKNGYWKQISYGVNNGGGAIKNLGDNNQLINCTFTDCYAHFKGGAINWYYNSNNGSFINCSFINCSAYTGGGAAYIDGSYNNFYNCSFVNNSASSWGGAIQFDDGYLSSYLNQGFNNVSNSYFYNNYADMGSSIEVQSNSVIIENSCFLNHNISGDGVIRLLRDNNFVLNCSFINNSYGFSINVRGKNVKVSNCSFINNSHLTNTPSYAGDGSSVYWSGDDGILDDCIFVNNSASRYGGAVHWSGSNGLLYNSSFINNSVGAENWFSTGGAVYWKGINGSVYDCIFVNNSARDDGGAVSFSGYNTDGINGSVYDCIFVNNSAKRGGAISWVANNGKIYNSLFVNCNSSEIGGAIVLRRYNSYILNNTLFNNTFINNTAGTDGGAINIDSKDSIISNSTFINNTAAKNGGAVYWAGTDGSVSGSSFVNCSASNGGAVYWTGNNGQVFNSSLENCYSNNYGGAIYFNGLSTVENCNFINNSAYKEAGAIYFGRSGTVENCNFVNNSVKSPFYGAGAILFSGSGTVESCNFISNSASKGNGGAIYFLNSKSTYTVNNSSFISNSADWAGAIYFWKSTVDCTITNCDFVNNTASKGDGGAISMGSGTVQNCSFINNSAFLHGGAFSAYGTFITYCNFVNNSAQYGGAILAHVNITTTNSNFINNSAKYTGGAIYASALIGGSVESGSGYIDNCSFVNNSAVSGGAIVFNLKKENTVTGCDFVNNSAQNGGAIYWNSIYSSYINCTVSNSSFVNCSANYDGGAIYFYNDINHNSTVSNSSFVNCSAIKYGGAIRFPTTVDNCSFVDCSSKASGGAVAGGKIVKNSNFLNNSAYSSGGAFYQVFFTDNCSFVDCHAGLGGAIDNHNLDNYKILNSLFVNNSATLGGAINLGSVYSGGGNGVIFNSSFLNNSAVRNGGAIIVNYCGNLEINGSSFDYNNAYYGGAVYLGYYHSFNSLPVLSSIVNSNFTSNSAVNWGGSLYVDDCKISIDNSNFINNSANYAGAIHIDSNEMNIVKNSNFIDNRANNGGGAIGNGDISSEVIINHSNFISNHANNYGGALSLNNPNVSDSSFINNSAVFGGALYSYNSTVSDSKFDNNNALELGNSIFAIDNAIVINSIIDSSDIYQNKLKESFKFGDGNGNLEFVYEGIKYPAFDYEFNLILPYENTYYLDYDIKLLRNSLDSSYIGDYLKILAYKYYPVYGYGIRGAVNIFGESDYLSSTNQIVKNVLDDYNSGYRAPDMEYLGSNTVAVYKYMSLISPHNTGNAFFIKQTVYTLNQTVTKEALNKTAFVGDIVQFRINVTNANEFALPDVFVRDVFNENELEYLSFESDDNWTYNINSKVFTLDSLAPFNTSSIVLSFKVKTNGTLTNLAVSGIGNNNTCNNTTSIETYNPLLAIEKLCLTPTVVLGETARFEILVRNNGDTDLHDVCVTENPSEGLIFDSYDESSLWRHSVVDNKNIWTLVNPLTPGSAVSLYVNFNTTSAGHMVNYVSVRSNETKNESTTGSGVDVIRPEINVVKIAINSDVTLGKQAVFEIIVSNPSKVALTGVTVYEDSFDGLIFDSYIASSPWVYSFTDGVNSWTFNDELAPGEVISLFTVFNTTGKGTFVNNVVVFSDTSLDAQANATVNVLVPELSVEKIVLTPDVVLGGQAVYEIVVHNTGETDLTNIVVEELPDSSLIYDHYVDSGLFDHSVVDNKHVWTLGKLTKGNYAGFIVYFNTTASGNVSNRVSVRSDETEENTTSSNNTNVVLPSLTVEKICLTPYVLAGNQTLFEIVIKNTGKVALTNVYFTEESFEGLIYDSALGEGIWTHEFADGKHTWTLNEALEADEFIGLILKFNTTAAGEFTNYVIAGSDQTGISIANATAYVFEEELPDPIEENSSDVYSMDVFKTVITKDVVLGGQVTFQIVIHNTGNRNLENVKVSELPPDGLVYDYFTDYLDLWTYNGDLTWTSNAPIVPGEYVGFFVTFNTTKAGNFANSINVEADETNATSNSSSFDVLNPDFTIEKVLVEDNIVNGGQATFEIVVHNTGNAPLTELTVREYFFKGLIYDHYVDYLDIWNYNGDLTWTLNTKLLPGEYVGFFVTFNTTGDGEFTNIVVANSSECGNKFSNNATVSVFNESVDVSMICLTPFVVVGNQAVFEITIQNTGRIPISVLKLSEFDFEGLTYDHYIDYLGHWINDGLTWTLNTTLVSREITTLFVVFNTSKVGNFTNVVLANKDVVDANGLLSANSLEDGIYVSAPVEVVKPEYTIEIIAVNKTVENGEEVTFEVIVHNVGKVDVGNITIRDIPSDGLDYVRFIDNENSWTKNDDLSWDLTKDIVPGQYSSFFIVFNTTKTGTLENTIESDNLTSKASVEVRDPVKPSNPSLIVEVEITTNPFNGQPVVKVTVINNGDVDLDNVFVRPNLPEGLKYGDYYSYDSIWNFNNGVFDLDGILKVGESKSFYIDLISDKPGKYQLSIDAGYNDTISDNLIFFVDVFGNDTPDNKTTPVTPVNDTSSDEVVTVHVGNNSTGNPLMLILLALFALGLTRYRRKN